MTDRLTERAEIEGKFAESSVKHFGKYASLVLSSGSFAYGGATKGKSDLDVMTVLSPEIAEIPPEETIRMIQSFVRDYVAVHREYGYKPDVTFPGEYITDANAEDAIAGRGFHVSETGLHLPPASDEYYLEDRERYYRAWRSMLAFSRRLTGNEEKFHELKLRAWETIMLFLLYQSDKNVVDTDTIINALTSQEDKWQSVGVTNKWLTFRTDERPYIEQTLVRLQVRSILDAHGSIYGLQKEQIQVWSESVSQALRAGQLQRAPFLLSVDNERELTLVATSTEQAQEKQSMPVLETEKYSVSPMKNRHLGDCVQVVFTAAKEERERDGLTDENIIVFVKTAKDPLQVRTQSGKLFGKEHFEGSSVLLRIASSCVHGSLGDMECSCYEDTVDVLKKIAAHGNGIFVYLPQDSLGRGPRDKVRDHRLIYGVDERGKKTEPMSVEQSLSAVHPEGYDIRRYTTLRRVFDELGLGGIEYILLGGNAEKIEKIRTDTGIAIASTMGWK
jgi:GTP cyclohydrolase II